MSGLLRTSIKQTMVFYVTPPPNDEAIQRPLDLSQVIYHWATGAQVDTILCWL